jgi:cupin fold WbuC family metalloprotein
MGYELMNYKKFNDEVYFTQENITKVSFNDIKFLINKAKTNERNRVRLCTHLDIHDPVHEMLIVHKKNCYVRPHKHLKKSESFHLIQGELDVVIFNEDGVISDLIEMGFKKSNSVFYYRLIESYYHTIVPKTKWVVFHETTKGPFVNSETIFANWAPNEDDFEKNEKYLKNLNKNILIFKEK